jgi:hypothetical protein
MTQRTLIERLSDLQYDAECFREQERALAELTAELDEVAQHRADAQERVEKLRPVAELLTRANTVLDELLKSHEVSQPPSRFAGLFESLFGLMPAASMTERAPAEEPIPESESVPEESEQSAEPEDVPQPDPFVDAPPAEPTPAGQEAADTEAAERTEEPTAELLDEAEGQPVTVASRVRTHVEEYPGLNAKEIADALSVNPKTVASALSRMVAIGIMETVGEDWPSTYKFKGVVFAHP